MIFNSNFLYVLSRQISYIDLMKIKMSTILLLLLINTNIPKKYLIHCDAYSLTQDRSLISEYLFLLSQIEIFHAYCMTFYIVHHFHNLEFYCYNANVENVELQKQHMT